MPLSRRDKSVKCLDHRRLAASGMPDDPDKITLIHLKRDICQSLCLSATVLVSDRDMVEDQNGILRRLFIFLRGEIRDRCHFS